jgi:hypothetical protein
MVGHQHARQMHAVGFERIDQIAGGVGRVDHDAVPGLPVSDQVSEIAHLRRDHVALSEVAAGEQLTEVQPIRV